MNLGFCQHILSTERERMGEIKMSSKYCVCDVCFFTAAADVAGHERQQQNLVVAWEQRQLEAVAVGAPPHQQQLASVV